MNPNPPALQTAATRSGVSPPPAIGACTIGCVTPNESNKVVRVGTSVSPSNVDHLKAKVRFKRLKISVVVYQGMAVRQTKCRDQAVNRFPHGVTANSKLAIIL